MGMGGSVTIGYKYFMGIHMGIGRGPMNALVAIQADGKEVFSGSVTSSQRITINKPKLFGGDKKEGGIKGTLDVMMGESAQVAPSLLASMLGGAVPGFRGMMTLFFDGQVSAMTPYLKPWKMRVWRTTAGWDGAPWYTSKATISLIGPDDGPINAMNPAHIIYECLTNRDWGGGMARGRLHEASFMAAADQLYAEGFGLCLRWNRQDSVKNFIQTVLDHIGANLYLSRFDGLFHLDLIRDDYDADSLSLFDEDSGLLGIDQDDNGASSGAVNELIIKWHDPIKDEDRQWRERNLAAIQSDGQVISTTLDYPGIPTIDLAGRVAVRELRARSAGLKRFKLRLDRRGYQLQPGQPLRIRSLKRGIETLVVRAGRIEDGTLTDGAITVTVVQDVFGLATSSMASVQPSGWVPPDRTPTAIALRKLTERTWRDLAQTTDPANLDLIDSTASYLQALAVKPTSLSLSYTLQDRVGSGAWIDADDAGDFCPSGLLVSALDRQATAFILTAGTDLDFVEVGGAALIDDEIVRIDSFDTSTLTGTMARGCIDTVPATHAAGARIWFIESNGAIDAAAYTSGATIQARLLTQTSEGQLDPALAAVDSLVMAQRQGRPYPPGQFRIGGAYYPASIVGDVVLTWSHRDRLLQADQLIDTLQGNIGPESGVTYSARLLRADTLAELVSQTAISGTTVTLATTYEGSVIAELWAVRDGLASLQRYQHTFHYQNAVTVVGYSTTSFVTDVSTSVTIPSATVAGDLLLACVMHRDTLTPPPGWTLVATAGTVNGAVYQYTSVYKRTADSGDANASSMWMQASAVRLGLHIVVLRGAAALDVLSSATANVDGSQDNVIEMASLAAAAGASTKLALACASSAQATSGATSTMSASAGWTQTTPSSSMDTANHIRMGVAVRPAAPGDTISGNFTINTSAGTNSSASVTVIVG
ncbi:phage tail protein [Azomonas macrocytogenes]|uniref:Tip attachment protein J domain-containing protein n=1 Tax=Azomonas macrocytogenes TaxID=69962 RepID=A0A839T3Y9_AZOMA|nr:phage tail protein [Azomonas macrocytogenes]MBB3103808.1 hypothetical protein [Azomonas macrocytogenes]